jgi:hypothetical protein
VDLSQNSLFLERLIIFLLIKIHLLLFHRQVVAQSSQQAFVAFRRNKTNLTLYELFGQRKQVAQSDK